MTKEVDILREGSPGVDRGNSDTDSWPGRQVGSAGQAVESLTGRRKLPLNFSRTGDLVCALQEGTVVEPIQIRDGRLITGGSGERIPHMTPFPVVHYKGPELRYHRPTAINPAAPLTDAEKDTARKIQDGVNSIVIITRELAVTQALAGWYGRDDVVGHNHRILPMAAKATLLRAKLAAIEASIVFHESTFDHSKTLPFHLAQEARRLIDERIAAGEVVTREFVEETVEQLRSDPFFGDRLSPEQIKANRRRLSYTDHPAQPSRPSRRRGRFTLGMNAAGLPDISSGAQLVPAGIREEIPAPRWAGQRLAIASIAVVAPFVASCVGGKEPVVLNPTEIPEQHQSQQVLPTSPAESTEVAPGPTEPISTQQPDLSETPDIQPTDTQQPSSTPEVDPFCGLSPTEQAAKLFTEGLGQYTTVPVMSQEDLEEIFGQDRPTQEISSNISSLVSKLQNSNPEIEEYILPSFAYDDIVLRLTEEGGDKQLPEQLIRFEDDLLDTKNPKIAWITVQASPHGSGWTTSVITSGTLIRRNSRNIVIGTQYVPDAQNNGYVPIPGQRQGTAHAEIVIVDPDGEGPNNPCTPVIALIDPEDDVLAVYHPEADDPSDPWLKKDQVVEATTTPDADQANEIKVVGEIVLQSGETVDLIEAQPGKNIQGFENVESLGWEQVQSQDGEPIWAVYDKDTGIAIQTADPEEIHSRYGILLEFISEQDEKNRESGPGVFHGQSESRPHHINGIYLGYTKGSVSAEVDGKQQEFDVLSLRYLVLNPNSVNGFTIFETFVSDSPDSIVVFGNYNAEAPSDQGVDPSDLAVLSPKPLVEVLSAHLSEGDLLQVVIEDHTPDVDLYLKNPPPKAAPEARRLFYHWVLEHPDWLNGVVEQYESGSAHISAGITEAIRNFYK